MPGSDAGYMVRSRQGGTAGDRSIPAGLRFFSEEDGTGIKRTQPVSSGTHRTRHERDPFHSHLILFCLWAKR